MHAKYHHTLNHKSYAIKCYHLKQFLTKVQGCNIFDLKHLEIVPILATVTTEHRQEITIEEVNSNNRCASGCVVECWICNREVAG